MKKVLKINKLGLDIIGRTKDEVNSAGGMIGVGLGKWRKRRVKNVAD